MGTSELIEIPVRWTDVDAYQHVSHMALVALLDDGRGRWLERVIGPQAPGWEYVVARLEVDFRAPAVLGERALFGSFTIEHVGTSSVRLRERLLTASEVVVVDAVCVVVAWDRRQSVSRALTGVEKSLLVGG
ncbi:acyl-CoA thioesterase [Nocardia fluminea]|uniref:acyl-CoA thioesterase n=1 Tax=Nocardia fluminea TaxID=134984 RepID=UPI000C714691|nr:acyl-CoA thioesterase [Nocardia fluminea]